MATQPSAPLSLTLHKPDTRLDMAPAEPSTPGSSTIVESQVTGVATEQVINTPELLESILLCLPGVDVARMRRVRKQINDTVLRSPKLRARLHLDAARQPTELLILEENKVPYLSTNLSLQDPYKAPTVFSIHPAPLFTSKRTPQFPLWPGAGEMAPWGTCLHVYDGFSMLRWRDGPWRKQFLTQPPCKVVGYMQKVDRLNCSHLFGATIGSIESEDGVTLGDLYDFFATIDEREVLSYGYESGATEGSKQKLRVDFNISGFCEEDGEAVVKARAGEGEPWNWS